MTTGPHTSAPSTAATPVAPDAPAPPNGSTGEIAPAPAPAAQAAPCPYCGHVARAAEERCERCGGLREPLSRQASQNAMGPWFVRDEASPHRPGCSYATLRRLAARGRITPETVLRGPTTFQFWMFARDTPGVSHLLGACHNCRGPAGAEEFMCRNCGAVFTVDEDRQRLGLARVRMLPGSASAEAVARHEAETRAGASVREAPGGGAAAVASGAVRRADTPALTPAPTSAPTKPRPDEGARPEPDGRATRTLRRTIARLRMALAAVSLFAAMLAVLLASSWGGGSGQADAPPGGPTAALAPVEELGKTLDQPPAWAELNVEATRLATSEDAADLARALELLRRLRDEAPVVDQPADIAQRIEDLARRLEAARLRPYAK